MITVSFSASLATFRPAMSSQWTLGFSPTIAPVEREEGGREREGEREAGKEGGNSNRPISSNC